MDDSLKQRLVGAGVIVAAGVLIIPLILPGPPSEDSDEPKAPVAINPSPPAKFSSSIVPADRERTKPSRDSDSGMARSKSAGSRAKNEGSPRTTSRAASLSVPRTAQRASSRPVTRPKSNVARGWAVQLGAFSEGRNALALRDRLKGRGYKAFVETAVQDGNKVTRVLVGPMSGRERAQAKLEQLRKATSLSGILVRYPKE